MQNTRFYEGDFKIISELGQGNFGKVYKIQSSRNGRYYVLKTIDMSSLTPRQQKNTRAEVEILQQLNHPHIIQFYDSYIKELKLHIIMEYAECGDLQKVLYI
jgi:serine/threonine protein kinase